MKSKTDDVKHILIPIIGTLFIGGMVGWAMFTAIQIREDSMGRKNVFDESATHRTKTPRYEISTHEHNGHTYVVTHRSSRLGSTIHDPACVCQKEPGDE